MNHADDPRKQALDDDERALARIARALPAGTPSTKLDASVLAAARAAAEQSSAPHRRLAMRWGMGASAAALLAVAVVWQWQHPEPPAADGTDLPAAAMQKVAPAAEQRARADEADAAPVSAEALDIAPPAAPMASPTTALPPPEADETLAPEDWIERIRARLAAGQDDHARRSLRRFVEVHPDHPLPDDLRSLAE